MLSRSIKTSQSLVIRHMACAYIWNGSNVLMLQKTSQSKLFPGMWVPVGGHIKPEEFKTPKVSCVREIQEETGLTEDKLSNLCARYITVRRKKDEIRIQHIFCGRSNSYDVVDSDEGELVWIPEKEILSLEMSYTNKAMLKHYLKIGMNDNLLYLGVVVLESNKPRLTWIGLESFDSSY